MDIEREKDLSEKEKESNEVVSTITMSALCCGNCMGESWEVCIGHDEATKKDFLIIRCANKECVEKVTKQLREGNEADLDDSILWKSFEITGQTDTVDMIYLPSAGTPTGNGILN